MMFQIRVLGILHLVLCGADILQGEEKCETSYQLLQKRSNKRVSEGVNELEDDGLVEKQHKEVTEAKGTAGGGEEEEQVENQVGEKDKEDHMSEQHDDKVAQKDTGGGEEAEEADSDVFEQQGAEASQKEKGSMCTRARCYYCRRFNWKQTCAKFRRVCGCHTECGCTKPTPEPTPAPSSPAPPPPKSFRLKSLANHETMCLDYNDGGNVGVWPCHDGLNQRWYRDRGMILRSVKDPTKCVDWDYGGGSNVLMWPCHGNKNQIWEIDPERHGEFFSGRDRNKCLDWDYGHNGQGKNVIVYKCHGGYNQMWGERDRRDETALPPPRPPVG